jgi:hypothetical protein
MKAQPTKYDWKTLLERIEVGKNVSLPLEQRANAAKAIQRLRVSSPAKVFTTRKMGQAVFKIERIR